MRFIAFSFLIEILLGFKGLFNSYCHGDSHSDDANLNVIEIEPYVGRYRAEGV